MKNDAIKEELISSIRSQLNIPKSEGNEWIYQTVYSLAGRMALASLWDSNGENNSVSVQHFKDRIEQILSAYESIYPEISPFLPMDKAELIDEIYFIYLRSGHFYHAQYKISPAAAVCAGYGDVTLHRGHAPDAQLYMSGLGFYSIQNHATEKTIAEMFGLQSQTFEDYLSDLLEKGDWSEIDWPESCEFLRTSPPFSAGYWQQKPDENHRISLARFGKARNQFVFYRFEHGAYYQKSIPDWRIRDDFDDRNFGEYRRIVIALLKRYDSLPAIKAKLNDNLVEIQLAYRLPPSEEDFFKLYSWPVQYKGLSSQKFKRKMTKKIYSVFRHELEAMGYRFLEE